MTGRETQGWGQRYPVCGKADGKREYRAWRKLAVGSHELPLLLVLPPEPLNWAIAALQLLEGRTVSVPDPSVKWEPPWQEELNQSCRAENGQGLTEDYWAEEMQMIRGQWYDVPRSWLKQRFDRGEVEVKISDWLPAVCGYCSLGAPHAERYAVCRWPPLGSMRCTVYGPSDLNCPWRWQAEIEIDMRSASSQDAFCFLVAHEIAHAIGRLHFVVPAIMNWHGFLTNVIGATLGEVCLPDDLPREFEARDDVLDRRALDAQTSEREYLEGYFGNQVSCWYDGFLRWARSLEKG